MNQPRLYDITEVCRMLNTTSRTLRFYEEKGIITSTKAPYTPRRHYTEEQVARIRYVRILRALGLSMKVISALQREGTDLRRAIIARRAEIYASIDAITQELRILNEALSMIEAGDTVENVDFQKDDLYTGEYDELIRQCTQAIVEGNTDQLYEHISPLFVSRVPPDVFERVRAETSEPLGDFVSYGQIRSEPESPMIFTHHVQYTRLCMKITYVFENRLITGLWLAYSQP